MRTVRKFALSYMPFSLDLPDGFRVVLVEDQGIAPFMWVDLDTEAPKRSVLFRVFGTGHEIDPDAEHCGSWQSGRFVWHLYRDGGR